jgi:hypothetical protein
MIVKYWYKWFLFLLQRNCLNGLQKYLQVTRGRVDEQTLGWLKQLKSNPFLENDFGHAKLVLKKIYDDFSFFVKRRFDSTSKISYLGSYAVLKPALLGLVDNWVRII